MIAVLHAGYLALFVAEQGVFEAARIYARQLLLSKQPPHLNKSPKTIAAPRKTTSRARSAAAGKTEGEINKSEVVSKEMK